MILSAVLSVAIVEPLFANEGPAPAPGAMVANPCPPALPVPGALQDALEGMLNPNAKSVNFDQLFSNPNIQAFLKAQRERAQSDWANLCRYREANLALATRPVVVFIGDSITENWVKGDPSLFSDRVVGRGIGGQTSPQIMLRFFQDVINLHPQVVHIMVGTNDIAGNSGATSEKNFENNIRAMVQLAQANHIKVALASIPPALSFPWNSALKPAPTIMHLNAWLRSYAHGAHVKYLDYYTVLTDPDGGLLPGLSNDGVHPNREGYAVMKKTALTGIH